MEILVTGGTGFLGQHLAKKLLDAGHRVHLLGRNFAQVKQLLAAGAIPVTADLRDSPVVSAACAGVEVVYHAGALSAPWGKSSDFYAINVGGTRAVLAGCQAHGVRRLIYVSSPSVIFDGHDHFNLTEDAPYPRRFTSVYALTKKLGEDCVRAAAAPLETVIVRPKALFGPGDRTLLPRLLAVARKGQLPQIGDGYNLVDLTYVENVAHALVLALESREAAGKTYTITNDEHLLLWAVIRSVLRRLGLSSRLRRLTVNSAMIAARLMEMQAALTGEEPRLTRYSVITLARTQTYNISAARRDLGYTPLISFADGMEATLQALAGEL
jgi:nucleoside-diphosphate-sugar epimerase